MNDGKNQSAVITVNLFKKKNKKRERDKKQKIVCLR